MQKYNIFEQIIVDKSEENFFEIFKNEKILIRPRNSKNIDEIHGEIIKITNLLNCKYNIINI